MADNTHIKSSGNTKPQVSSQPLTTKTTIKTNGKEFKTLIKECLKELIQEGALNHMLSPQQQFLNSPQQQQQPIQVIDPRVQYAAQVGSQIGGGNKVYESIFADTMMNTIPQQQAADPQAMMGNPYVQPMQYQQQNPYAQQQQPQYMPQQQQQQYVQPYQQQQQQQPQYLNNPQQQQYAQPYQQQQQQPQQMSNWARLAFTKPTGPSILSGLGMGRE